MFIIVNNTYGPTIFTRQFVIKIDIIKQIDQISNGKYNFN